MRNLKRWISLLLMFSLVAGLMPGVVIAEDESFDPYVYYWISPHTDADKMPENFPEHYKAYAGKYIYHSPFYGQISDTETGVLPTCVFNLVNTDALLPDGTDVPEGAYASEWAYCVDIETYIIIGTAYRRMNLEDSYFCYDSQGNYIADNAAPKLRAVVRHSFPTVKDMKLIQNAANAYLTKTYGEDAVLIQDLTGSEAVTATQTAIWHLANGKDFVSPYPYGGTLNMNGYLVNILDTETVDAQENADAYTATNIRGLYEYLINLEGEAAEEICVTQDTVELVGTTVYTKGSRQDLAVFFKLNCTINGDDDLTFTANLNGKTLGYSMGKVNQLKPYKDDVYCVTFENVTNGDLDSDNLVLKLEGCQTAKDVFLYEAKPAGDNSVRKTSQNLIGGMTHTTAPVQSVKSYSLSGDAGMSRLETGNLQISKAVVNSSAAQAWESFDFRLDLDLSGAPTQDFITEEYLMSQIESSKAVQWTRTGTNRYTAGITLRADEEIVISGLPVGSTYTIEELVADENRPGVNVSATVNGDATASDTLVQGTVARENAVRYTNTFVILETGSIELTKTVENADQAQDWKEFDFRLTLDLNGADVQAFENPWVTDDYLMNLVKATKALTWVDNGDGTFVAEFTLKADETVAVTCIPAGTAYTVEEIIAEENRVLVVVEAEVTAGNGQVDDTIISGTVVDKEDLDYTNTFVELELGKLEISKKVVNSSAAQAWEQFSFRIVVDLKTAEVHSFQNSYITYDYLLSCIRCDRDLSWTPVSEGVYMSDFVLRNDESITISGLPVGTQYQLVEQISEEDRKFLNVTAEVLAGDGVVNDLTVSGTIAGENAVRYTNTFVLFGTGALEVSKKVINSSAAQAWERFRFRLELDLSTANVHDFDNSRITEEYLMSLVESTQELSWTLEDGKYVAEFVLRADETVTVSNIPVGSGYTLEELVEDEDRKFLNISAEVLAGDATAADLTVNGTIAGENAVLYTNTFLLLEQGALQISKAVINSSAAQAWEEFAFRITLDLTTADVLDFDNQYLNYEYLLSCVQSEDMGWVAVSEGVYEGSFVLRGGESTVLTGLPVGAKYTLEEQISEENRKFLNVTAEVLAGDATAEDLTVNGTIAEKNAVLYTNTFLIFNTGALEVSKQVINSSAAQAWEEFVFRITLDLTSADVLDFDNQYLNYEYLLSCVQSEDMGWVAVSEGVYEGSFVLRGGESTVLTGLPVGAKYTLEEQISEENRKFLNVTAEVLAGDATAEDLTVNGTIAEKNAVLYTNTFLVLKEGTLQLSKSVINSSAAQAWEEFRFALMLDLSSADILRYENPYVTFEYLLGLIECDRELAWEDLGNGRYGTELVLKADETLLINNIPSGTGYFLKEQVADEDRKFLNVSAQVLAGDGVSDDLSVTGTIADANAVLYTNTFLIFDQGALEVGKTVINGSAAQAWEIFSFRLTLNLNTANVHDFQNPWVTNAYLMTMVQANQDLNWTALGDGCYAAEFTLRADETVTVTGIPAGSGYTLEEIVAEEDRVKLNIHADVLAGDGVVEDTRVSGIIAQVNTVRYTNTFVILEGGKLWISKNVVNGSAADQWNRFTFRLTVDFGMADVQQFKNPWITDAYLLSQISCGRPLNWTLVDGRYVAYFTLRAGETIAIEGIPTGSYYRLEEVLTVQEQEVYEASAMVTLGYGYTMGNRVAGVITDRNGVLFVNTVRDTGDTPTTPSEPTEPEPTEPEPTEPEPTEPEPTEPEPTEPEPTEPEPTEPEPTEPEPTEPEPTEPEPTEPEPTEPEPTEPEPTEPEPTEPEPTEPEPTEPEPTEPEPTEPVETPPQTGDSSLSGWMTLLLVMSAALCYVLLLMKRRLV